MRLQLRVKFDDDVRTDWIIMLGRLFNARYVRPQHVLTIDAGNVRNETSYVQIEIDGSQEFTPEHWQYIKDEEYTLRFIEPSVLPDEEET